MGSNKIKCTIRYTKINNLGQKSQGSVIKCTSITEVAFKTLRDLDKFSFNVSHHIDVTCVVATKNIMYILYFN